MSKPYLEPRKFRIIQDITPYVYFVTWMAGQSVPWAIELAGTQQYFTEKGVFDYQGEDTIYFDTAEAALEWWKKMMRDSGRM
jgi:hypothetical protein